MWKHKRLIAVLVFVVVIVILTAVVLIMKNREDSDVANTDDVLISNEVEPEKTEAEKQYLEEIASNDVRDDEYYNNAITQLQKDIDEGKQTENTYVSLAYAYERLGKFDKAIESYQEASKIANNSEATEFYNKTIEYLKTQL